MELIAVLLITAGAIAVVILPVVRGTGAHGAAPRTPVLDDAAIDIEIERFRAALRSGTVCGRCHYPNPAGSRFCADCGRPVPATTHSIHS